jgi:hypothetical protein
MLALVLSGTAEQTEYGDCRTCIFRLLGDDAGDIT